MPPQIIRQQHGSGRDRRKDVAGKLRLREREENNRHDEPAARENSELQFEVRLGGNGLAFRPPDPQRFHERRDHKHGPRHERESRDGKVIPERLAVMVQIAGEARQIVLQNEFAKELRIPHLHCDVPGQRDRAEQENARQPERSQHQAEFARAKREEHNDGRRQKRRDRPLGQHPQRHADVEQRKIDSLPALAPGPPREHSHRESRGQRHVHRGGTGVPDHARTGSRDQRRIDFHPAAESAEEKINGDHQQSGVNRRRDARRHIAHAEQSNRPASPASNTEEAFPATHVRREPA